MNHWGQQYHDITTINNKQIGLYLGNKQMGLSIYSGAKYVYM